uniref:AlNc14C120G6646 protein n=1 Tax=Albugo laibachii Nc14 TaxID=890382 RepID=F0WJB9_9STRA|nr:AlNc14C120G6646 [Albugo laibachii Nc14]|eukprot:CCA21366.1 AlNc14C120G6646 [Albugo laibachii Nc14]
MCTLRFYKGIIVITLQLSAFAFDQIFMDAPSCSSLSNSRDSRDDSLDMSSSGGSMDQQPTHDMFGDWNLNMVMMVLLMLYFMQNAMRDSTCGC